MTVDRAPEDLIVLDLATFVAAPFRCTLLGAFGAMQERIRRRDEIGAAVQDWVGKVDARTVLARLDAAEVPCGPINKVRVQAPV